MNVDTVAVGIDIGTTAAKALACTTEGLVIAEASERYGFTSPLPGFVEQNADAVYLAVTRRRDGHPRSRDARQRARRDWG
jgi:sugar (pentulose or hexulose) kinase